MLKDNLYYFDLSMKNPEPIWDQKFYPFKPQPINDGEYETIIGMEEYIDALSATPTDTEIRQLLKLLGQRGAEKSYFAFFLRTCDLSRAELIGPKYIAYYSEKERIDAAREATRIYKENRKGIRTHRDSLQAYNDAQTAKRRSDDGEKKFLPCPSSRLQRTWTTWIIRLRK